MQLLPRLPACVLAFCGSAAAFESMNGDYKFANQLPGTNATHRGTAYFDAVTQPIVSYYGQVNWDVHTVPLDPAVVKQLDGKLINIVGYEFDIRTKDKDGNEISVPGWEQYNHHYVR